MRKILFSLFAGIIAITGFAQENTPYCSKRVKYLNTNKISPYISALQVEQQKKYDVTFYNLYLTMSNQNTFLEGITEIHAKAMQAIDSALLEFFSGYLINDLKVNGNSISTYVRNGSTISVPLNLNVGDEFVIAIDYAGTAPTAATNPLGGSGMTNDVSPSWGNRVTWSLSEPFSAFEWFPCKQDLKDKADSCRVTVKVPDDLMAGSNGKLDSVTVEPGFKTFHWMHRHPIAYYLISVAVSNYQEYTIFANPAGSTEPVMIQNFIYDNPDFLPYYQNDINQTVDMIELFADVYGPYPFQDEKYGHCIAPLSGGMEHQTMTTQGFFERTLTAHELAHQWWGNNVTCASWADIWINEGFASYSEYLTLNALVSFNSAQQDMNQVHSRVMQQPGGSVFVVDSLNEGAIFNSRLVYDKGAAIVHTLRYIINNDTLFFNLLKAFQQTFAESNATGLQFKAFAEQYTGMDFTDFFEQWYFGEGYPTYSVKFNPVGSELNLLISQTTSRPTVTPFFTNPIDLRISRSGGLGDTIVRVNITGAETQTVLSGMDYVTVVAAIDPTNYIINKIGTISKDTNLSVESLSGSSANELILYPNPTLGNLTVQFEGAPRIIRVIDQFGKIQMEQTVVANETIDVSQLPGGQYLIELQDNQSKITNRSVIKR